MDVRYMRINQDKDIGWSENMYVVEKVNWIIVALILIFIGVISL